MARTESSLGTNYMAWLGELLHVVRGSSWSNHPAEASAISADMGASSPAVPVTQGGGGASGSGSKSLSF